MMGIGSPVGTLVSDVNRSDDLKQLQPEPSQCNGGVMGGVSLNDLGDILTEFLQIQDGHELASNNILSQSSDKTGNITVLKEDGCEENQIKSTILTSDIVVNMSESVLVKSWLSVFMMSTCTPLKLVSAMKGSREKWGTPPKKLTVSWAPDVYDPPPSAPTSVRINKPRSKSESKKNGKSKLKGKSSKGASSKDKRQVRKHGGSSNKCYRLLDDFDKLVDYNEPPTEHGDFDVGSPDSYFGSSFL
ncbi:uncharacterized protein LOC130795619 isoform X2 [Actinidia eriantha]|uniref:uncharacterized protein LOC130795619 isoform X2 n=1 Tax=Actinidia eriantha TaxID=165200 RepID=UPI00258D4EC8|nr:uncharacterized protein LOC130795619 isoform X2 [Actinidia eriantha]